MDSNQVIFDISSDEEPASFEEVRGSVDDDHDWLTELLETVDRETADSSDEVVIVGEYIPSKPKSKSKSLKPVKDIVVDDDDCVVLDRDPEKAVSVVDDGDVDKDGDDVLVVGQKGQIACRDYPHPRHLCAKYPFSSTPHERHCELCHCYVCDSVAPCTHWGTGFSNVHHCHATDKLDMWKRQRESFRLGRYVPLPVSKFPDAHLPVPVPHLNQVAPLEFIQMAPNLGTHDKVSRPITIRACSSARSGVPNIISRTRNRRPGYIQGRNGYLPRSVYQQANGIGIHNDPVLRPRDRGQQFMSSNTMFKRPGIIRGGPVAVSQSAYGSSNLNCASASHYVRNALQQTATNTKSTTGWPGILPPNMTSDFYACLSPSQPNMDNVSVNTVPPFSEPYCKLAPQLNDGKDVFQYGNQSQNIAESGFPDFCLGFLDNSSQSNQHPLGENIHQSETGNNNAPTTVKQLSSQFTESTEHHHKDHEYENWFLAQADAVASEVCGPAELNVFSPEASAFDAGMLCFDFETSWNGLAQV